MAFDWLPGTLMGAAGVGISLSTRRQMTIGQRPNLSVRVARVYSEARVEVWITNAGPGVALDPAFAVAIGEEFVARWADPARLTPAPGASAVARTDWPADIPMSPPDPRVIAV